MAERSNGSDDRLGRPRPSRMDPTRPTAVDEAPPTPTVRISGRDRSPFLLTALIAAFLGVAMLKPWVEQLPGSSASIAPPRPIATNSVPPASTGPDPLISLREHCQEPLGWRVYSREAWNGRTVRTWRSLEPAAGASGPLDPTLPTVPLGPSVEALGYCSPWDGSERVPSGASVAAWRLDPAARGSPLTAVDLLAIAPEPPSPLGELYGALGDRHDPSAPGAVGWEAGRYVFAIRSPGWERWWAVDIAPPDAVRAGGDATGSPPAGRRSTPTPAPSSP